MAQVILDPAANGLATAWVGAGYLEVSKGATIDDTTYANSGVTIDTRESYRVPNVTSGQIPDGSTINFVRLLVRAARGGASNAAFVAEVSGAVGSWSSSGTLTTTATFAEFTADWATDPSTTAAWTVATLRSWSTTKDFAVRNTQTRDVRVSRVRVLVDYTPPAGATLAGAAIAVTPGAATTVVTDGITLTGITLTSELGSLSLNPIVGAGGHALTLDLGSVSTIGAVIVPPVGYAGRWPDWLDANYESLDPYFLAPVVAAIATSTAVVSIAVSVAGNSLGAAQGDPVALLPGGTRTANLVGGTITSATGFVFRGVIAGGAVVVRARFKTPRGYERWRQRTGLNVTAPAFVNSARVVALTGQQLSAGQGVTIRPGAVQPFVQVVSRRLRDRVRGWLRRSSVLTVVTRQLASTREALLSGRAIGAAQGVVTVTIPRTGFIGQNTQLVSTRTRIRWQLLGRRTSRLTTVSSTSANTRYKLLTGLTGNLGQGTVTTTGIPLHLVNAAGSAGSLVQGVLGARTTDAITLVGQTLLLQQGSVIINKLAIQGSVITIGQGAVSMGAASRTITLSGNGLASFQGTLLRTIELQGNAQLSVVPIVRKYVTVSIGGDTAVTFEHQVIRGGLLRFDADATLTVSPTQKYVGTMSTGGTATLSVDLLVPASTVSALYQQFEAEQQLGYKI